MANPASATHFRVTLGAGAATASGSYYTATYTRLGGKFWGGGSMVSIRNHDGTHMYYWAAPGKGTSWIWGGSYYYIMYNGKAQVLSANFHASGNAGGAPVNGYRWATSFTETWYVGIDRGNARQGSRTVWVGAYDTAWGAGWVQASLTLYTTRIGDVSNVKTSASVDNKNTHPNSRYIRASLSFTNPEGYYTGYIDGVARTSYARLVTKNDFNKNIGISWFIRGRDGATYASGTMYTGLVEPGGVGVWWKESNTRVAREVAEVWYKDSNGNIKKVEELWARRGRQSLRTVK